MHSVADDEESFVESLLNSLGDYPRYYHRMGPINRQGAPAPDLSTPPLLDGDQLCGALTTGTWVVDLRGRGAFAANHLAGSLNFELDAPFTTYLGWLLPDDVPVVLMAENPKAIAVAQLDLARIGIERPAGHYVGRLPPKSSTSASGSYPVRGFDELGLAMSDPMQVALDVRRADEWEDGTLARCGARAPSSAGGADRRSARRSALGPLRRGLPGRHRRQSSGQARPGCRPGRRPLHQPRRLTGATGATGATVATVATVAMMARRPPMGKTWPMTDTFAARFALARARFGPLAWGFDPSGELLGAWGVGDTPDGLDRFVDIALEAAVGTVGLVKLQSAFYERHGWRGVRTLQRSIVEARSAGLLVIVDAKRGDVGTTNDAYAEAFLGDDAPSEPTP